MSSTRTRTIRLLDYGFYPRELPPPFQTRNFGSASNKLSVPDNYQGSITFFDGATHQGSLRRFGVINPANYLLLSRHIAEHWPQISSIYNKNRCSISRPKFTKLKNDSRVTQYTTIKNKQRAELRLASTFPIIVRLDINRFYESIYTHSIPWAALGKENAKQKYKEKTLSNEWSDELDILVRKSNENQTIGLPIGPDTSRIISELLLSRISFELTQTGSCLSSNQIYHSIDDYLIGTYSLSEAEIAKSCFSRILSRYGLRLNDVKTTIGHGLEFSTESFKFYFSALDQQSKREFIENFFEVLYYQIPRYQDINVVGYALRKFSKRLAQTELKSLVCEHLQRLLLAFPYLVSWVLPLLLGFYAQSGINSNFRKLIYWGIENCTMRNDVGSLLWYLYSAIFLGIRLGNSLSDLCLSLCNELVDLMLFHGKYKNLFVFNIAQLRRRYIDRDFQTSAWLPIYEIARRGWDLSPAFNKIGGQKDYRQVYKNLCRSQVEFYLTDEKFYRIEALSGWKLTKDDFIL